MKCSSCGTQLQDQATVCYQCGTKKSMSDTQDYDQMFQKMVREGDSEKRMQQDTTPRKANDRQHNKNKEKRSKWVLALSFCICLSVVALWGTLFVDWFTIGGNGAAIGVVQNAETQSFLEPDVRHITMENAQQYIGDVVKWSPIEMLQYTRASHNAHAKVFQTTGELKNSIASIAEIGYIYGWILIFVGGCVSILLLIFDRKQKWLEGVRVFSLFSLVIIGLNYLAIKVPFLNMIALQTQGIMRKGDVLNAVQMSLKGIKVNNLLYTISLKEHSIILIAIGIGCIWLLLSTILVELKKDKEDSELEQ